MLREKKHMTQEIAAMKIGIKYRTYQTHEAGQCPNRETRNKYLYFYGCDESWFLTGKGEPYNKGIEEGIRTAEGDGLWGQTRRHKFDGKQTDVTLLTPKGSSPGAQPPPDPGVPDPFLSGVGALRTVFDSGDPMRISAIQTILTTFEQAALNDRYLTEQSKRIQSLEEKLNALEERIKEGDALAGIDKTGTDAIE